MTGRKFFPIYGGRRGPSCIIKGTVLILKGDTMKDMIHYIAMLPAIAIAISIFNYAQAKMAIRLGDTTPRQWGRDTINPFAHIDLLGILVMLIASVGWSKPIPFSPYHFKNPRTAMIQIALAGLGANILVAFVAYVGMSIAMQVSTVSTGLQMVMSYIVTLCIGFGVFNMLPVPGFIGFYVLLQYLSYKWQEKLLGAQLWFFIGILVLGQFGFLGSVIRPVFALILGVFENIVQLIF